MGIIQGKKLMVFVNKGTSSSPSYVSIGYATSHTLSMSASTIDTAHKDLADTSGTGHWDDQEVDTLTWTVSAEAFYSIDAEGESGEDIFDLFASGATVELKFGLAANSTTGVPTGGWVPVSGSGAGKYYSGKAIITSLDINAAVAEKVSYSISFQGKGALSLS